MHVFFSGIGGAGIGPLALVAKQAGYKVSGSDANDSSYLKYLVSKGISDIHVGQSAEKLAEVHARRPIDWFVYSSALPKTDPNHPELAYVTENGIRASKRDEFLNEILAQKKLKLIAIAGTHGKTTTTAMAIWLFKHLDVPVSYSVGAKLSFGEMGEYTEGSEYFIYEADEYDHNFLAFHPYLSLITGVDWDHPDIYPTRDDYYSAFKQFLSQTEHATLWKSDVTRLKHAPTDHQTVLREDDPKIDSLLKLPGLVNRQNAWLVANGLWPILNKPVDELAKALNDFPGLSRRFEMIAPNIYSDYAHTPAKIRGALQLAREVARSTTLPTHNKEQKQSKGSGQAGDNVVIVYEGLHNLRQHFIKDELKNLFDDVKQLYVVPTYLAREDPNLPTLTPESLIKLLSDKAQAKASAATLDEDLQQKINQHAAQGDIVLVLSAGGAGSLDEWLRQAPDGNRLRQAPDSTWLRREFA